MQKDFGNVALSCEAKSPTTEQQAEAAVLRGVEPAEPVPASDKAERKVPEAIVAAAPAPVAAPATPPAAKATPVAAAAPVALEEVEPVVVTPPVVVAAPVSTEDEQAQATTLPVVGAGVAVQPEVASEVVEAPEPAVTSEAEAARLEATTTPDLQVVTDAVVLPPGPEAAAVGTTRATPPRVDAAGDITTLGITTESLPSTFTPPSVDLAAPKWVPVPGAPSAALPSRLIPSAAVATAAAAAFGLALL